MNRLRILPLALGCACLMALSACGGEDTAPKAEWNPPAAGSPAAGSPAAAAAANDKTLCETAKKASDEMKLAFLETMASGGEPSREEFSTILGDLKKKMTATAATGGGDSGVSAALTAFGDQAGKAAAAADPGTAAADPAFEKAGDDLTAACKKAGVTVKF